jgi:uncharacterized protein YecT (DUF1311 family)
VTRIAVALAATAALAGGVAAARPGPPQIKESLTPLPCPAKPKTTLQLGACAGQRVVRTDAEINRRVRVIWGLLRTPKSRTRFAVGEHAWLAYRRASCLSQSDAFADRALANVQYVECAGDLNRQHIRQLTKFDAALRRR